MPSGTPIDWSKYDSLIVAKLPSMTVQDFVKTYLPHISAKSVSARARKIEIKPLKHIWANESRQKLSRWFTGKKKNSIDWVKFDKLILENINTMTSSEFIDKYNVNNGTLANRLRKLGVKFRQYTPTAEHRRKTSDGALKPISRECYEYVRNNLNKLTRWQISKDLGITIHLVNRIVSELGLNIDKAFMLDRWRQHGHNTVVHILKNHERLKNDIEFRKQWCERSSNNSKELWTDEKYRLKVRNGIRRAYEQTDYANKISKASKLQYQNNPSVRQAFLAPRPWKNSKLNDKVAAMLDGMGIKYEREVNIGFNLFDFKIENILLEVQSYWHTTPGGIHNDHIKASMIANHYPEYKLKTIWDNDIRSVRGAQLLLETIEHKPIVPVEVNLDDLQFTDDIKYGVVEKFLSRFHYLGGTKRVRHVYGLTLHGEVIAIAVFGNPVRQNIPGGKVIELTRLCRHARFHNKNTLSYLLSRSIRKIRSLDLYDVVVSYADLRVHNGAVYRASNWIDVGDTQSDYEYMSSDNIPTHKKTLYNKAVAAGLTEAEYVQRYGFRKVDIGRKRKFMYKLRGL